MKKRHLARTQAAATVVGKGLVKITIDPTYWICGKIADQYRAAKTDITISHASKNWGDMTPDEQFKAAWLAREKTWNSLYSLPEYDPIVKLFATLKYQFEENRYRSGDYQENERGLNAYKHLLSLGVTEPTIEKFIRGSVVFYNNLINNEEEVKSND